MKKLFSILAAIMILAAASFSATAQEVTQDIKSASKNCLHSPICVRAPKRPLLPDSTRRKTDEIPSYNYARIYVDHAEISTGHHLHTHQIHRAIKPTPPQRTPAPGLIPGFCLSIYVRYLLV